MTYAYLMPFRKAQNFITQVWSIQEASVSPRSLLKIHNLTLHSRPTESVYSKIPSWFTCTLKFEKCWPRWVTRGFSAFTMRELESQGWEIALTGWLWVQNLRELPKLITKINKMECKSFFRNSKLMQKNAWWRKCQLLKERQYWYNSFFLFLLALLLRDEAQLKKKYRYVNIILILNHLVWDEGKIFSRTATRIKTGEHFLYFLLWKISNPGRKKNIMSPYVSIRQLQQLLQGHSCFIPMPCHCPVHTR